MDVPPASVVDAGPHPSSQTTSHFQLQPVSGATLYGVEVARRRALCRRGPLRTGCAEIDHRVLVDGFERGCVVGVSAEDPAVGLLIGLQTLARHLVCEEEGDEGLRITDGGEVVLRPRASVVTTLAVGEVASLLRDVIRCQLQTKLGSNHPQIRDRVMRCLNRISISRVFDLQGLWEVLNEIETSSTSSSPGTSVPNGQEEQVGVAMPATMAQDPDLEPPESSQRTASSAPSPPAPPVTQLPPLRIEVLDSEDEGGLSSSESESQSSPASRPVAAETETAPLPEGSNTAVPTPPAPEQPNSLPNKDERNTGIPDIILITHVSVLLGALFASREKSSAHAYLQLLSSHLRHLSRASGPLIMLLNSTNNTTFSPPNNNNNNSNIQNNNNNPDIPGQVKKNNPDSRALDPTLRSIFNPPPPPMPQPGGNKTAAAGLALSRKNKPAFGLTFTQFLDLHLLCTRVPRTRADAELLYAPQPRPPSAVQYAWAVEVLLDEGGFWAEKEVDDNDDGKGWRRENREQRWGAVRVEDGVRVADAFREGDGAGRMGRQNNTEAVRVVAGLGGPRV